MNVPRFMWERIMNADNRKCQYCGTKATQVDHVVPLWRGGSSKDANLVAACRPCNMAKGALVGGKWTHDLKSHPRVRQMAWISYEMYKAGIETINEMKALRRIHKTI